MIIGLLTSSIKAISASKQKSKKVDRQKLLPGGYQRQNFKPGEGYATGGVWKDKNSIIVRPKTSISSRIKVTNYKVESGDNGSGRSGALLYESLSKRLDALVKNTDTLTQIAKDQYKDEVEDDRASSLNVQRVAKKTKEEKAEAKAEKKLERNEFGLRKPKLNMFEGLFSTLQKLVFGTAVMELLRFFSDPKKAAPVLKFLQDNFVAMFVGTMVVMGAIASASLLSMGGMLTLGLPLFFKLAGLLSSILLSPPGLVALAALGLIAVFATPTAKYDEITGENAVWKQPGLKPAQRKAIIEGTFGHLTPDKWDPEALRLYKQTLQELKLDFDKSIAALEPERARARAIIEQQRREGFFEPQTPAIPGQASKTLAAAAQSMKGFSSAAGPDGGKNGCVWAVNKVFDKAGLKTPWGKSNWVPDAEEAMIRDGYRSIEPGEQKGGDLYIAPGQRHVGIVLDNGNIISNSSTAAAFTWEATPAQYAIEYGGEGKYYRMPEQLKPTKPAGSSVIDEAAAISRSASYDQESSPTIVPIIQPPPQLPSGGGGSAPSISNYNGQNQLNNYYRNQILGSLYRQ